MGHQLAAGDTLPTIYRAYKPVEEYLEALEAAGGDPPPAAATPLDALVINLLVGMYPRRPTLVDLAGAATHGASTVLCCTTPHAARVVRDWRAPRGAAGWRRVLEDFLDECEARCRVAAAEWEGDKSTPDSGPFRAEGPAILVTAAHGESPENLASHVRAWQGRGPDVLVLVLALGETGQCAYVRALAAAFGPDSPYRFVLARERAAALHGSTLGLVYPCAHPYLDHALDRLANVFRGGLSFLSLVKRVCEDAIRSADLDNTILEAHPLGHLAGTRRRIGELEHALAARDSELAKVRRRIGELEHALAARDGELAEVRRRAAELEAALGHHQRQTQEITRSLTFKVLTRVRGVRRIAAPDGTVRHRLVQRVVRAVHLWRSQGLAAVLARTVRKSPVRS
jgi:hypothetical protein